MVSKLGASTIQNESDVTEDIHRQIWQDDTALVIVYCSSHYDLDKLASALKENFGDTPLIGCTTAGEIGPNGIQKNGVVGISIKSDGFHVASRLITDLDNITPDKGANVCQSLNDELQNKLPLFAEENSFFLNLIDGISSKQDELFTAIHNTGLNIPMIGGSAADNLLFKSTFIYYDGAFHLNSAVISLIHTDTPFTFIKDNAYERTGQQVVVTAVNENKRTISSLNGDNPIKVYANTVKQDIEDIDLFFTTNNPLAVHYNNELYVRAIDIQKNEKGALELPFFCKVEEGMLLHAAKPLDSTLSLKQTFNNAKQEIGEISAVLGFDCSTRVHIYEHQGNAEEVSDIMKDHHVFGFQTYGEQFFSASLNQTFIGVAFGSRD